MKTSTLRLLPISLLIASATTSAGNFAIDARGDAMGGVGVVSGDFLTAPFYNPALTAIYRRNDTVGMLLPSVGFNYNDQHDMLNDIDRVIDGSDPDALDDLDGDSASVTIGASVAFAIPNRYVSMNAYGKIYSESFAQANVGTSASNSTIDGAAIGVAEGGLSLAKYMTILGHHWSFGVTPKLQRIYISSYSSRLEDFSLSDVRDNGSAENKLNYDLGALWFYGPFRVGINGKNMISRDIITSDDNYSYRIRPQYTLGTGIIADFWQVSVDYDLNEAKKFTFVDDNTQMLRLGAEVDLMRQFKFRGGYYKNLASSEDEGTLTAGLGISPLNITQMDIGVSYTNENAMGVYLNFLSSY
ncbi:conjugal transfer protein TraF [Vibrio agarivorans]|uniref:conjugal transfer protein TraF n=1 Tax=Vibrio agarivorans TaxID=153622 RepID=UPI00222F2ACD|nr:conjugal transfer protein TraF [Vibrio agarivorans]